MLARKDAEGELEAAFILLFVWKDKFKKVISHYCEVCTAIINVEQMENSDAFRHNQLKH